MKIRKSKFNPWTNFDPEDPLGLRDVEAWVRKNERVKKVVRRLTWLERKLRDETRKATAALAAAKQARADAIELCRRLARSRGYSNAWRTGWYQHHEVLVAMQPGRLYTSAEVAKAAGLTPSRAFSVLRQMAERGEIRRIELDEPLQTDPRPFYNERIGPTPTKYVYELAPEGEARKPLIEMLR